MTILRLSSTSFKEDINGTAIKQNTFTWSKSVVLISITTLTNSHMFESKPLPLWFSSVATKECSYLNFCGYKLVKSSVLSRMMKSTTVETKLLAEKNGSGWWACGLWWWTKKLKFLPFSQERIQKNESKYQIVVVYYWQTIHSQEWLEPKQKIYTCRPSSGFGDWKKSQQGKKRGQ